MKKKETVLRKTVKDAVNSIICSGHDLHVSWIESHLTAIGFPDFNYCCHGVEGNVELKAGPDIDVLASQVLWMKARTAAGGWPLFLIQWGNVYSVIPGVWAADIRKTPSEENTLRLATTIWWGEVPPNELLKVLRNPKNEYTKSARSVG